MFNIICTEPGKVILEIPCISDVRAANVTFGGHAIFCVVSAEASKEARKEGERRRTTFVTHPICVHFLRCPTASRKRGGLLSGSTREEVVIVEPLTVSRRIHST